MKKTAFISDFLGDVEMGAQMRHIQSTIIQNNMCHFVGPKQPFVWSYKPLSIPIVVKNIPFVRFSVSGFTLIELIVTLAVAAILVVVAVPNMRSVIQNNRIRTLTKELISDNAVMAAASIEVHPVSREEPGVDSLVFSKNGFCFYLMDGQGQSPV